MKRITSYYNGESYLVDIVSEEDLPRACDVIDYVTDEETFERFVIYKDFTDRTLYAVKED